jgi:O-antigen/teichoic acid export membrane protein
LLCFFLISSSRLGVSGVLCAILLTACAGTLIALINIDHLNWSMSEWREFSLRHWHFSKWQIGTLILSWASGQIFLIFAGAIIGASAVGILMAAQSVMAITHIFILGLQNFLPVHASKIYREGGVVQLSKFIHKAAFSVTLITGIVALIVCIFPNRIMELLYGSAFRDYGWVLIGYAFIYVLGALGLVFPVGLLAMERTFPVLLSYICSAAISIVTVYPLVTEFGLVGVLVGLATYAGVQFVVSYLAFRRLVLIGRVSHGSQ